MILRVLFILFAFLIITNIIITLVSFIFGINLYKKHIKTILKGYGIFILLFVITYIILAILGLS